MEVYVIVEYGLGDAFYIGDVFESEADAKKFIKDNPLSEIGHYDYEKVKFVKRGEY